MLWQEYLVTRESADKPPWDENEIRLFERIYLLALGSGAEGVAEFGSDKPESTLPAVGGCNGLVDHESVERALKLNCPLRARLWRAGFR